MGPVLREGDEVLRIQPRLVPSCPTSTANCSSVIFIAAGMLLPIPGGHSRGRRRGAEHFDLRTPAIPTTRIIPWMKMIGGRFPPAASSPASPVSVPLADVPGLSIREVRGRR